MVESCGVQLTERQKEFLAKPRELAIVPRSAKTRRVSRFLDTAVYASIASGVDFVLSVSQGDDSRAILAGLIAVNLLIVRRLVKKWWLTPTCTKEAIEDNEAYKQELTEQFVAENRLRDEAEPARATRKSLEHGIRLAERQKAKKDDYIKELVEGYVEEMSQDDPEWDIDGDHHTEFSEALDSLPEYGSQFTVLQFRVAADKEAERHVQ